MPVTVSLFELPDEAPETPVQATSARRERRRPPNEQPALPGMALVLQPPAPEDPIPPRRPSSRPQVFGRDAVSAIVRLFEKAYSRSGLGSARLFDRWLACCHLALDRLPSLLRQVASGEPPEDSPEQQAAWQEAVAGLPPATVEMFSRALVLLLDATGDGCGGSTYADVVGQVFERVVAWPGRRKSLGQFFTPPNVAAMMAEMLLGGGQAEALLRQRFEQKCRDDPWFAARALTASALGDRAGDPDWVQRQAVGLLADLEPLTVLDPCVGSGVMLLAAAQAAPRWMVDAGLIRFYGVDIDATCVEMARLNVRLYGLNGTWLAAAEALSPQQLGQLPWPYGPLYANAAQDAPPGQAFWMQGVAYARAGRLDEWEGVERLAGCVAPRCSLYAEIITGGKTMTETHELHAGDGAATVAKPSRLQPPDLETLIEWEAEGGCEAACPEGCWVEPDGICPHGNPSWLIVLGLI